ncbi:chromate efflux transporter [Herbiconiux sp. P15]|uniref:chromate efflux transporter n=1 Tax=Herbiconiux liukaitaii TaxID=3342799 RepID=UPI0035B73F43
MRGSVGEVLLAFLRLGLTSFGGPIAHLGYFRGELVERRKWVDDAGYGDLVALSQFLPGPASSQVGFGLGWLRAGPLGALAAFAAFTAPSAVIMVAVASGASLFDGPVGGGIVAGLSVVAVAVVAQAVWGMARNLTPDRQRAGIAVVAAIGVLLVSGPLAQVGVIVVGALAGLLLCRDPAPSAVPPAATSVGVADGRGAAGGVAKGGVAEAGAGTAEGGLRIPVGRVTGWVCLGVFGVLLVGLPVLASATGWGWLQLFDAFYRSGALVFGGGHVVLPLLEAGVVDPGWVSADTFVAGYGAAQALPGPLFSFAAYLGALSTVGPGGIAGAAIALAGIFLPGFLLLVGVLPLWNAFSRRRWATALVRGANAAVVGLLAAALYDPVFVSAVTGPASFCLALLCFVLLTAWRAPAWAVVLLGAAGGLVLGL